MSLVWKTLKLGNLKIGFILLVFVLPVIIQNTGDLSVIRRTYQCLDCEQMFTIECNADDLDPICPNPDCNKVLEWRPQSFAIGGSNVGKAAKLTQQIMEEDYGFSNFRDNAREGETAVIPHHETKAETELVTREVKEMTEQTLANSDKRNAFWGGNAGAPASISSQTGSSMIQMAKVGPQGPDPMQMLHSGVKQGRIPTPKQMMRVERSAPFENPARKK